MYETQDFKHRMNIISLYQIVLSFWEISEMLCNFSIVKYFFDRIRNYITLLDQIIWSYWVDIENTAQIKENIT